MSTMPWLPSKELQMKTTNTSQKKKKYCGQQIFAHGVFYRKGLRHRVPSSGINSTDHLIAYPITFSDNHGYFRVHFDGAEMFGQIVHIDGDGS